MPAFLGGLPGAALAMYHCAKPENRHKIKGLLISGVVVTESVFNLPGVGRLTVDAVLARDFPVIQAMILLTSGIYVLVNLLIDLAYSLLDPRIRY